MLLDFSLSFKHTFSWVSTGSTKKRKTTATISHWVVPDKLPPRWCIHLGMTQAGEAPKIMVSMPRGEKNTMVITQMIYIIYAYVGIKYMHIWYLWLLICEINLASKQFFPTNSTQLHSNPTPRQSTPLHSNPFLQAKKPPTSKHPSLGIKLKIEPKGEGFGTSVLFSTRVKPSHWSVEIP